MVTALSSITSNQAKPTEETMSNIKFFLDYAASNQDAIITYRASDMVLAVHSDASYLSKPKSPKLCRGPFIHVIQHCHPGGQWRCPQHCPDHQSCYVWRQKQSSVHCTQSSTHAPTPCRNGTYLTTNANPNRQQHGTWSGKQQHPTSANESHGYVVSLAMLP